MNIVLDVSAVSPVLLAEQHGDATADHIANADSIIAPELFIAELGNVLWKYVNFHDLDESTAIQVFDLGLDMIDDVVSNTAITSEAMRLAIQTRHPVYDCLYLTLARRTRYTLLTHDKKLKSLARSLDVEVL